MLSYTYKFVWMGSDKIERTKFVDAPSKIEAQILFKEWFGFEAKAPLVEITRLTGADN